MKKMMKTRIALLLAVVLVFSFSVTAYSAGNDVNEEALPAYEEQELTEELADASEEPLEAVQLLDDDVTPDKDNAAVITADYEGITPLDENQTIVWYSFTPEQNAWYTFESTGELEAVGYLFEGDTLLQQGEDSDYWSNFLIREWMQTGKVYYLGCECWDADEDHEVGVSLKKGSEDPDFPDSGVDEDGIRWQWRVDKTLLLSGEGKLTNPGYDKYGGRHWNRYSKQAEHISIGSGITGIEAGAFADLYALQDLTLPDSLDSDAISEDAFGHFSSCFDGVDSYGNVVIRDILADHIFEPDEGDDMPVSLTIPKEVKRISAENGLLAYYRIREYVVEAGNPYFATKDGALFNKDLTELIAYPSGSEADEFAFPDVTQTMRNEMSRYQNVKLAHMIFGKDMSLLSVKNTNDAGMEIYPKDNIGKIFYLDLQDGIDVPDTNAKFSSENGALYNKDQTTLYYYPRKADSLSIGSMVTTIAYRSLANCQELTSLEFPGTVKEVQGYAASNCEGLATVTIPASVTKIADLAFAGCENLKEIHFLGNAPEIGEKMVSGGYSSDPVITVYYPAGDATWADYVNGTINVYKVKFVEEGSVTALKDCKLSLAYTSCTYNGSAKKPKVTVKDGSRTLTVGTDYSVSYKNNINAGKATVTVKGKGSYTGTATLNFQINKASQKVTFAKTSITVSYGHKPFYVKAKSTGDGKLKYISSDPAIATVNQKGLVTIKKTGTVKIGVFAQATDNYKKSPIASCKITIKKGKNPLVVPSKKTFKYNKKKNQSFTIKVKKAQGKVTFKSSDSKNVSVSSKGVVVVRKGAKKGTYKIRVVAKGNSKYASGKKFIKVIVK